MSDTPSPPWPEDASVSSDSLSSVTHPARSAVPPVALSPISQVEVARLPESQVPPSAASASGGAAGREDPSPPPVQPGKLPTGGVTFDNWLLSFSCRCTDPLNVVQERLSLLERRVTSIIEFEDGPAFDGLLEYVGELFLRRLAQVHVDLRAADQAVVALFVKHHR